MAVSRRPPTGLQRSPSSGGVASQAGMPNVQPATTLDIMLIKRSGWGQAAVKMSAVFSHRLRWYSSNICNGNCRPKQPAEKKVSRAHRPNVDGESDENNITNMLVAFTYRISAMLCCPCHLHIDTILVLSFLFFLA